jgi:hypothetical protein
LRKYRRSHPPAYPFGTVITTLAAMVRGVQVKFKHGVTIDFSCRIRGVAEVFTEASKFINASFNYIAARFTSLEKNEIVEALKG